MSEDLRARRLEALRGLDVARQQVDAARLRVSAIRGRAGYRMSGWLGMPGIETLWELWKWLRHGRDFAAGTRDRARLRRAEGAVEDARRGLAEALEPIGVAEPELVAPLPQPERRDMEDANAADNLSDWNRAGFLHEQLDQLDAQVRLVAEGLCRLDPSLRSLVPGVHQPLRRRRLSSDVRGPIAILIVLTVVAAWFLWG